MVFMEDEVGKETSTSGKTSKHRLSINFRRVVRKMKHLFASFGNERWLLDV